MRQTILVLLCCSVGAAQMATTKGRILQPSGDASLTNIMMASAVTPSGSFGYTAQVYLVKGDGSAAPRRLTNFDESNQAMGATSVAISSDGTRAAYIVLFTTNGISKEEVHAFDVATGNDRLIASAQSTCSVPPCLGPVTFAQDGTKLLWGSATPASTTNIFPENNRIYTANFDGSGVMQLPFQHAFISGPNNVTTTTGRFIFDSSDCPELCGVVTANLDGSGASVIERVGNTGFQLGFEDSVISTSGAANAEIYLDLAEHLGPVHGPAVSSGTCMQGFVLDAMMMGSLTISDDGMHVAGVSQGQIFNCESAILPLNELYAFDVELSGDGSRMIFSASSDSAVRAAVWIADASGGNSRPIFAPRSINDNAIAGIGSYPNDILPLSPGSYFTIYGNNFLDVDEVATPSGVPFPLSFAGVGVQVNGTPVPVEAVTPWQVNALLPQQMAPGKVTVLLQLSDGTTLSQTASVEATAPAIDLYSLIPSNLQNCAASWAPCDAAAFHPGTKVPADYLHPAVAGEVLETYGFGLGVTTAGVTNAGAPANPPANAAMPFVNIDGVLAQTTFAGLVPGVAGVYQVNVVVPAGLPAGKHRMHWYSFDPAAGPQGILYTK